MPRRCNPTVADLCYKFLAAQQPVLAASTYNWYKSYLHPFADRHGRLTVDQLTSSVVRGWVIKYPEPSQHAAARSVVRVMNWAIAERMITTSPLAGYRKPAQTRRETSVTPAQYSLCLNSASKEMRVVIKFLWHTGCRPQELRVIEGRYLKDDRIVLPTAKSKGKKRQRVIYLDGMASRLTTKLVELHGDDVLFRNSERRRWTKNTLALAFRRLRDRLNIPGLCAYSFRHAFITRMLERGVDVATVAAIAGNSPRMVLDQYNHVAGNDTRLRAIVSGG